MLNRPARSFLAILVVVGSAVPGFVAAGASAAPAAPVVPSGGCWRYVPGPDPEAAIDDATDITDISASLEPWAADPKLTLDTAGDTAAGGVRTFSLDIAGGPSVAPQPTDIQGAATYFFDVLDPSAVRTELAPIQVDFTVKASEEAIPEMRATGSFPLAIAGTSALILRAVYFDLPGLSERLACNGQTDGNDIVNPATTPLDTSVLASATSVSAPGFVVTRVAGQDVVTAGRLGDEVDVTLTGFASELEVPLEFCGPGVAPAVSCGPKVPVMTLADGSAAKTLVVPDGAVVGAGSLRARTTLGVADVVVEQPMRVLGAPAVELRTTAGRNRLRVVGSEWNPLQEVRVVAVDDEGDQVGKVALVDAGLDGRVDTRFTVPADGGAVAVVATQPHRGKTLEATVEVPASGAVADGEDATDTDTDDDAAAADGATDTTSSAPAVAETLPLDIPAPADLPVTTVTDPAAGGVAGAAELAVTKVTLAGSTTFSDLFGGGPERVLKLKVENIGAAEAIAPGLTIAVGKGKDAEPIYVSDGFSRLAAGETRDLAIPIGLPAGAFGVYTVTGQIGVGDSGAFSIAWETYPWGLFGLNALGLLLIAFAVRRRVMAPAPSRVAALVGAPGGAAAASGSDAGAAVIDLVVLERWWALQTVGEGAHGPVSVDTMTDAVVDVAAVERWLERCSSRNAEIG